jgi:hypothetical protein
VILTLIGNGQRCLLRAILVLLASSAGAIAAEGRHALIIGIGEYSRASQASPLPGIPKDMQNARRLARAMGIDDAAIVELRDQRATKENIITALRQLRDRVHSGDRVLIYFSGHGTRFASGGRCVEGLQTYTQGPFTAADVLSEEELAQYTHPISEKADKIITLMDACFSGGVLTAKTRSLTQRVGVRPKYSPQAQADCSVAVNDRNTRSFEPVMTRLGAARENFVQIAAANYNEVSWDFPELGGLATHSLTQCLLGEAKDLDRSGAISLEEVRQCAQAKVDVAMKPHAEHGMFSSTIQLRGTRNLIVVPDPPPQLAQTPAAPTVIAGSVIDKPPAPAKPPAVDKLPAQAVPPSPPMAERPSAPPPMAERPPAPPPMAERPPASPPMAERPPAPPPIVAPPAPVIEQPQLSSPAADRPERPQVTRVEPPMQPPPVAPAPEASKETLAASAATLEDIFAQRNGRLKLEVTAPTQLTIGKDPFSFSVRSSIDGYLYAVMLGSDGSSFYLLFPNKLDPDNRVKANTRYTFPRPGWSIKAAGPEGVNRVLFVVSPSARDPKIFAPESTGGGGPFTYSVADLTARKRLIDFFVGRGIQGRNGEMAASLVSIREVR